MGFIADFKKFVLSGSLVAMAVAFVVGLAIVTLIGALVTFIIDPLIGAAGHVNFANLGNFTINGSTIMGGAFVGALINFVILMLVVFALIAYPYQKHEDRKKAKAAKAAPTVRDCPECFSSINIKATRCPFCTSEVTPLAPASAAK